RCGAFRAAHITAHQSKYSGVVSPQARIAGHLTFHPLIRFRPQRGFLLSCPTVWPVCYIPPTKFLASFLYAYTAPARSNLLAPSPRRLQRDDNACTRLLYRHDRRADQLGTRDSTDRVGRARRLSRRKGGCTSLRRAVGANMRRSASTSSTTRAG